MTSTISITGNVIEDENLGITDPLATDVDASNPDTNVILSVFQNSITIGSPIGSTLSTLGIYPDAATSTTASVPIGISDGAIVSTTDSNLGLTDSAGQSLNGVDSKITALDGSKIFLYSASGTADVVLGREGGSNGTVAFALLLQPSSGGATVWVIQYEALNNPQNGSEDLNTVSLDSLVYVSGSSTSTSSFNIGTKQPGANYWLPFTSSDGKSTVLLTGLDASASSPDTVNTSQTGDGSNSQSITPGTALRFDFVSGYQNNPATGTKDKAFLTDKSLNSLAYIEGTIGTFDISQTNPTGAKVDVQIYAQDESASIFGTAQTSTASNLVPITEIKVFTGGVTGTLVADSARAAGSNNGVTFGSSGGVLDGTVQNLAVGETIEIFTGTAKFDQFVVKNVSTNKQGFDILNVTETQSTTTTEQQEVGSHIIFEDSVPTLTGNTSSGTVDEDALVSLPDSASASATATGSVASLYNAGVDTPLTFVLSSTTASLANQNLTSAGHLIDVFSESQITVAGITTDTLTAGTSQGTVFTLDLIENGADAGKWTFTLKAPIDQPPSGTEPATTSIDFSQMVTATDKDGSSAPTAAAQAWTVNVIDDVPLTFTPEAIVSADNVQDKAGSSFIGDLTTDTAGPGEPADPYPTLNIDQHAGADGFGDLSFTGTNGSTLTDASTNVLTANKQTIYLFGFGTGTLTATTDQTGAGLPGSTVAGGSVNTADEIFTITTTHASDQYTFDLLRPIDNGSSLTFSDFADVKQGDYAWFSLPFNPTTKQPVSPGPSAVFSGLTSTDTVAVSSQGVGSDKQAVAPGHGVRVDFVDDVSPIASYTSLKSLTTLGYADHYEVNNSGFAISQVNPTGTTTDIHLDAFNVPTAAMKPGGGFPTDSNATDQTILSVTINTPGGQSYTLLNPGSGNTSAVTAGGFTAYFNKANASEPSVTATDGVDVLNLALGDQVLVSTANGFDRLLATNVGGSYGNKDTFDMGAVSVQTFNAGQPLNMAFNLALRDADAYASNPTSFVEASTGTLNVTLTAPTQV